MSGLMEGGVHRLTGFRDYATWTNMQENIISAAMSCDYKMVGVLLAWCCYANFEGRHRVLPPCSDAALFCG